MICEQFKAKRIESPGTGLFVRLDFIPEQGAHRTENVERMLIRDHSSTVSNAVLG